jgi:hypothetical protein
LFFETSRLSSDIAFSSVPVAAVALDPLLQTTEQAPIAKS